MEQSAIATPARDIEGNECEGEVDEVTATPPSLAQFQAMFSQIQESAFLCNMLAACHAHPCTIVACPNYLNARSSFIFLQSQFSVSVAVQVYIESQSKGIIRVDRA